VLNGLFFIDFVLMYALSAEHVLYLNTITATSTLSPFVLFIAICTVLNVIM
jgi:hypothetical protein